MQTGHLRADEAPLQTARIATALIQLNKAQNKLVAAEKTGDEPTIAAAEREIQVEKHNLAVAIKREAERLSRFSSFGAPAHHAGDLRKVEARIRGAFPSDAWRASELVVSDTIRNIDRERLPLQLQRLSGAMRHALSNEQKEEANVILAGVNDFVLTEPRNDLAPSKVSQLERLRGLVRSIEKVDSKLATTELFAMMVIQCANEMKLSGYDDLTALRGIVGYRNTAVNEWIVKRPNTPEAAPR